MSIKYYQLAKDEEPPDEFCAVRDVGGEPSEYTFYVPESENAKLREQGARLFDKTLELGTDNAKLRELVRDLWEACPADGYYCIYHCEHYDKESESHCKLEDRMAELGIEAG